MSFLGTFKVGHSITQIASVGGKNDTYLDWDKIEVNFFGEGVLNAKNLKGKEKG